MASTNYAPTLESDTAYYLDCIKSAQRLAAHSRMIGASKAQRKADLDRINEFRNDLASAQRYWITWRRSLTA